MNYITSKTVSNLFSLFFLLFFFLPNFVQAQCDQLNIAISSSFLEKGGGASDYQISYCNNGTTSVNDVIVEVAIDPELNVLSSSISHSTKNGNTYTFSIGDLDVAACGNFSIEVEVKTTAFAQQTHCTTAEIYPDAGCSTSWNGATIEAEASCLGTSIDFDITNVGSGNSPTLAYSIFEDDAMIRSGTVQLNSLASTTVTQEASPGLTYRIVVDQDPAYPTILGDPTTTVFVENCNASSSVSTGYGLQFSNGNSAPNIAVDCQENVNSYTANEIFAQPVGYDTANYIYDHTQLNYKIVFQNTSNSTATDLTITQPIDSNLDQNSLVLGSSSHTYTWQIINGNELKITFEDIDLPTSTSNEEGSLGFVHFTIAQDSSNTNGTLIDASAAIQFDNDPVINTDTLTHTVDENFELLPPGKNNEAITEKDKQEAVEFAQNEQVQIKIYPNPFAEQVTFELQGSTAQQFSMHLYDVNGRLLQQLTSEEQVFNLARADLTSGLYVYQLYADGQLVKTGKVVAK